MDGQINHTSEIIHKCVKNVYHISMDRRIDKTKYAIKNAFIDLLQTKSNQRITITEIADKANIGRKTFYLHYNCIEDVVNDIEKDLETALTIMTIRFLRTNPNEPAWKIFTEFNQTIQAYLSILEKISHSSYYFLFKNFCYQAIRPAVEQILINKYGIMGDKLDNLSDFYASGVSSLYAKYFQNKSNLSLDDVTKVAIDACFLGLEKRN